MPETAPHFNHNEIIYSVGEISGAIKRMVEDHFGLVKLRGEISGYKLHSSGHGYFALKDDSAVIDAVCWRGSLSKMSFKPEDGLEVVATGRITTYPGRSKYQIVVERMEPAGAGALMALLEKRKAQLAAEGLFAESRKKPLPYLPRTIGVVTSPTGAVIRDILHRIADRFPCHVIVWPVAVQGEGAAEQIAAAIRGFNSLPPGEPAGLARRPDLLIVARGGGSLEDLWAFNEEVVVRAAAGSAIPLISAVGHETDTTLIDFASDRRAPTPTAAAEMAVPVLSDLRLMLAQMGTRQEGALKQRFDQAAERLSGLARGLPRPAQLLQQAEQRLDDWSERLLAALPAFVARKEQQLLLAMRGLSPVGLNRDMARQQEKLTEFSGRMQRAMLQQLQRREERMSGLSSLLEQMNVQRVLERGFALVRDKAGVLITTAKKAKEQRPAEVQFSDGRVIL